MLLSPNGSTQYIKNKILQSYAYKDIRFCSCPISGGMLPERLLNDISLEAE